MSLSWAGTVKQRDEGWGWEGVRCCSCWSCETLTDCVHNTHWQSRASVRVRHAAENKSKCPTDSLSVQNKFCMSSRHQNVFCFFIALADSSNLRVINKGTIPRWFVSLREVTSPTRTSGEKNLQEPSLCGPSGQNCQYHMYDKWVGTKVKVLCPWRPKKMSTSKFLPCHTWPGRLNTDHHKDSSIHANQNTVQYTPQTGVWSKPYLIQKSSFLPCCTVGH